MKKLIALLLAVMMVMALCACGDTAEETTEAAPVAEAEAAPAAEAAEEAAPAAEATTGDLAGYIAYCKAYAEAGAPTDDEKAAASAALDACTTAEEVEACTYLTPMYENSVILTYADWTAAGCPAADTSNMSMGDPNAGASSEEPAA